MTERPEALEQGAFLLAGTQREQILSAVETALAMANQGDLGSPVPAYADENVSCKVASIIQSYTIRNPRK